MNKFESLFKPLKWCMALLLAAFVAGCGGDGGGGPGINTSVGQNGAVCTAGATCVDLLTAGTFTILAQSGISSVPTSAVTGNVGLSPATGAAITGLTCAEVTGTVSAVDAAGPAPCSTVDAGLTQAVTDSTTAFTDADTRPGGTPVGGTIDAAGCAGAGPGVYSFGGAATITEDCTLTGGPTAVWIFQITGTLSQAAGTTVTLAGGALPQNVFWQTDTNVVLGDGAHLEGIVLAGSDITLGTGASVDGRLFSGTAVVLNANTIVRP